MYSKQEQKFIDQYEAELKNPPAPWRFLVTGVPAGLMLGLAIVGLLSTGWYERAIMQMVKFNPYLLLMAILFITIFFAWIYRKFRREMMDQQYQELKARKQAVQRNEENAGHEPGRTD